MELNEGVEWALHTCLNLSWVEGGEANTTAQLAAFYDLPAAYLSKQLQALTRAGVLSSTPGPRGGFRLARDPEQVGLLNIVVAIEGRVEAFGCEHVLADGPGGDASVDYALSCVLSQAMSRADLAWRRELARQTLADIRREVEAKHPQTPDATRASRDRQRSRRWPEAPRRR